MQKLLGQLYFIVQTGANLQSIRLFIRVFHKILINELTLYFKERLIQA